MKPAANPPVPRLRLAYPPPPSTPTATTVDERTEAPATRQWQANLTSALGAALCVAAGASLAAGLPLPAAAALFSLGALCDLADGTLARAAGDRRPSQMGAFVDSFCDKVGEGGMFVGILVYFHDETITLSLAALAFVAGWLTSWAKAFAEAYRFEVDWSDARIFGRAGRAVLLSATLALASVFVNQQHTVWMVGLSALLAFNCATLATRFLRVVGYEVGGAANQ